jgi:hypothetical protein
MTSRSLHLSRMMKSERLVIALLRGEPSTRLRQDAVEMFAALRRTLTANGCSVAPPTSPFLRQEEARLLAQLATMQRQSAVSSKAAPGPLTDMIKTCAARLKDEGILLDFRSVARSFATSSGVRDVKRRDSSADDLSHRPTMEARAMDFLSERGQATTSDLVNVGISR